jgi:hypothetical protein
MRALLVVSLMLLGSITARASEVCGKINGVSYTESNVWLAFTDSDGKSWRLRVSANSSETVERIALAAFTTGQDACFPFIAGYKTTAFVTAISVGIH